MFTIRSFHAHLKNNGVLVRVQESKSWVSSVTGCFRVMELTLNLNKSGQGANFLMRFVAFESQHSNVFLVKPSAIFVCRRTFRAPSKFWPDFAVFLRRDTFWRAPYFRSFQSRCFKFGRLTGHFVLFYVLKFQTNWTKHAWLAADRAGPCLVEFSRCRSSFKTAK